MKFREYELREELRIDWGSLVIRKLLVWSPLKTGDWEGCGGVEEGFKCLKRGDNYIFSDGKFVVARGFNKSREINYVEAIPWKEPSAKDAIQRLSVLQRKLVERSSRDEVDFVVNLWGVVGGLQVSWQLQDVIALIREKKFKQEWIVIQEKQFVLFKNERDWEIGEFPVSVLELFAKKKFPGKFKIVDKFKDIVEDLS